MAQDFTVSLIALKKFMSVPPFERISGRFSQLHPFNLVVVLLQSSSLYSVAVQYVGEIVTYIMMNQLFSIIRYIKRKISNMVNATKLHVLFHLALGKVKNHDIWALYIASHPDKSRLYIIGLH